MEEEEYLSLPEYAAECYLNMVGWVQYARAAGLTSDDEQEFPSFLIIMLHKCALSSYGFVG